MTLRLVAHRLALVLATALFALGPAWAADPAGAAAARLQTPRPAFPLLTLAEARSQGQRAVDLLGSQLPAVAAWYGKSADEFRALLLNDRRLRLDVRGRLFVEDTLDAPLLPGAAPAAGGSVSTSAASAAVSPAVNSILDGVLLPVDQTFLLHSRPGAQRTIYLNFKGATLTGTAWNSGGSITAQPFDLDGLPNSFTTAELQRIQAIWQRIAEDYALFDVDVTTEAPAADVLNRSSNADTVFGTTVLITNSTGVYSCSCGGVAYIGAFDEVGDFHKPALVFYNQLGSGNEKYVAEAASHEAGHNVGLLHDGYPSSGYYPGHGSGDTGWAPIMGVGYYQSLVQWSKGEYAGANNVQDDFVVMGSYGLPIRSDDHGDTIANATVLTASESGGIASYAAQGVVERPSDLDLFGFVAGAGAVNASVKPAARSANLDAQIELLDAAGHVLASANPADLLPASLSAVVPTAGTYYLRVQGVGKGDPLGTGYTDYGSLGYYAIAVTAAASVGQPPVAVAGATPTSGTAPLAVAFSSAGSNDPDGSIVGFAWNFGDGASASGATANHVYTTPGSYTAELTVTDNSGLSASQSVQITVDPEVVLPPMRVADIAMSLSTVGRKTRANAVVQVRDDTGKLLAGATVTGNWSGLVSGAVSAKTTRKGVATLRSPSTASSGTFIFTVTGITLAGYEYQSGLNTETSDSITKP